MTYSGPKKKTTMQKTIDWATRTPQKSVDDELMCSGGVGCKSGISCTYVQLYIVTTISVHGRWDYHLIRESGWPWKVDFKCFLER